MSRVAILADVHGNLAALEAVVVDAEARGCTAFLNLGDCLSGPLWPAETADLLIARDWPTIAGNHERQLLGPRATMGASDVFARDWLTSRHLDWIAALPPTIAIGDILLCHGTPASDITHLMYAADEDGLRPANIDDVQRELADVVQSLILCGHTHLPKVLGLPGGRTVANPGSVGLQAFTDDRPCNYVVEVGDPKARYAVIEDGAVTLVAIDYDHRAAVAKAAVEGFDEWARWLATGRVTA